MSRTYAQIKTDIDTYLTNNPAVKVRLNVHNTYLTEALQLARDRIGNVTFDQTDIEDEVLIYYDSATGTYKNRKIQWHTVADLTAYAALAFDTDYFAMDYIEITDNGYGQTELRRYIDGAIRTISKYTSVTTG